MTEATQTGIIISFFGAMLLVLLAVIGFAGKKWFDHIDKLQESVESLRDSITSLSDKFVTQVQHRADLEALRFRRATDTCPADECPYEKTDPAITLTGSGAKSIKELIEAMRKPGGDR